MGALAFSALEEKGSVIGVIPEFMRDIENANELTQLVITKDMHERKMEMTLRADAIVALPGGTGTFEELLEAITWKKLGLLRKPIVIVNTRGFYDPLVQVCNFFILLTMNALN